MITKLTKEQEARFPEFVQKWTAIGLSTEPSDRAKAEQGVNQAYAVFGLSNPKIVWCDSPLSLVTRSILHRVSVRSAVDSAVASAVASVRACVVNSVWAASAVDSVRACVVDSVMASVMASVRASVVNSVMASVFGQHDASWLGLYDFFSIVCSLQNETEKLNGIMIIAKSAGWWLPYKNICWISERHQVVNRNEAGRLHKDLAPAILYPDGFAVFALNGVRMKAEHVLTPAGKIDPAMVLAETNVDVRRELIRKVGIERMLAKLPHKTLHKLDSYELLEVKLSDQVPKAIYLKMINPSIQTFHMEGVPAECTTVEKALNWRNSNWHETPEVLT